MAFKKVEEGKYRILGRGESLFLRLYYQHPCGVENYTWYYYTPEGWMACTDEQSNELDKDYEEQYAKQ